MCYNLRLAVTNFLLGT